LSTTHLPNQFAMQVMADDHYQSELLMTPRHKWWQCCGWDVFYGFIHCHCNANQQSCQGSTQKSVRIGN